MYPQDLKPLTSLRFLAAFWVLAYHFRDHLGLTYGDVPLVAHGWLGVDLFFVLSGFILTHVYLGAFEAGRYDAAGFLWARLARVYPLHLATLAVMVALYLAAGAVGRSVGNPDAFAIGDIPAHLALVHAWGATAQVGWNFPSWSISAEWAAYLLFPAFLWLTAPLARRPLLLLALAIGLFQLAHAGLTALYEQPWGQLTAQGGVWRILPLFLIGVALRRLGAAKPALSSRHAAALIVLALGGLAIALTQEAPAPLAVPALAALIYGLAETARRGVEGPHTSKPALFLGEASYALYMIHLPVDVIAFTLLAAVGVNETAAPLLRHAAVWGVMAACVALSALTYLWLEKPAREWLRARRPRLLNPAPAPRP